MTVLARSLIKPARTVAHPAVSHPADAHLWRGVTFCAPIWNASGAGVTPDVASRAQSNANGGTFTVGPRGPGWRLSASGAGRYVRWPSKRGYHIDGDIAWSCFVAVDIASWTSASAGPIGAENATTSDGFWRLGRANGGPDLSFVWRSAGANSSVSWAAAFTNLSASGLGYHTFIVTRRPGGLYELFVDGKSLGVQTKTNANVVGTHDLVLGTTGSVNQSSASVFGLYYIAAVWQYRTLGAGHARQLHADPFRMLRPADGARVVYDVAHPNRPSPGIRIA